jgi:hypothetical protein
MDNMQKEHLIENLDLIEKEIPNEDIYVGFNGHGHLKYIQATRSGLLKLGIFFIKSSFSQAKYIDIYSENKRLEWVDPESEEEIHYIEIIEEIEATIKSRKIYRQDSNNGKLSGEKMIGWIIYVIIFCILALIVIGFKTIISWI